MRSSPFLDATIAGMWLEHRYGDPFVFGIQGGAYLGQMVRLVLRLEMPSGNATDNVAVVPDYSSSYIRRQATPPTLLYGASVGLIAASSESFLFSPGLVFSRSDVSDYGSMLGVAIPFEWVTSHALRFGLEVSLGRAFGGTAHYACQQFAGESCTQGTIVDDSRNAGRAYGVRFQMGFGFNHPQLETR